MKRFVFIDVLKRLLLLQLPSIISGMHPQVIWVWTFSW